MGGNLFNLTEKEGDGITNLHSLWDSGVYEFATDVQQPLNETGWEWLGSVSDRVRAEFTRQNLTDKLKETDSKVWAKEGYEHATQVVYKIKEGTLPTDEYVK